MNLMQMKYLTVLADTLHVTQAANELHITQSALSKAITRIEEETGIVFFDRSGKHIRLSADGKELIPKIKFLLDEAALFDQELQDRCKIDKKRIVFATSVHHTEATWLQNTIADYIKSNPSIEITCFSAEPRQLKNLLKNKEIDFAITGEMFDDDNTCSFPLYYMNYGVLMSPDNPLATKANLCLMDLADESIFCFDTNSENYDLTLQFCRKAGFNPRIIFNGNFPFLIGRLIYENHGVTLSTHNGYLLSEQDKPGDASYPGLCFRELNDNICNRLINIAIPKDTRPSRRVNDFISVIKQSVSSSSDLLSAV